MQLTELAGTACSKHHKLIKVIGKLGFCAHVPISERCTNETLLANGNGKGQEETRHLESSQPRNSKAPAGKAEAASGDEAMLGDDKLGDGTKQPIYTNGNGHGQVSFEEWQNNIYHLAVAIYQNDEQYHKAGLIWDDIIKPVRNDMLLVAGGTSKDPRYHLPDGRTWAQAEAEIDECARRAWEEFRAKYRNELIIASSVPAKLEEAPLVIPWESFDAAVAANDEYLKREPVVDKLCYSHAVSMITGGKHAGKSTLARWLAVCVCKGWEFLKREVRQGPVMYIASEDETMAARQELLRLGWERTDPLYFLSATNAPNDDQAKFMARLTQDIIERGVKLVVIDMLFDFVSIQDEIKYAETRRAVGVIQTLASLSGTHVVVIHHAPKYADSAAEAGVTALGSQGLAARVSPIILVRRHGSEVHSVSSTAVRDPRGQAIEEAKLVKNLDGSVTLGGGWKMWMQADVFAPRVIELLQTEPGAEMTCGDVKDALGISYQLAAGALSKLAKEGTIHRSGEGKKGKPYRYSSDPPTEASYISHPNGSTIHHGLDPLRKENESHPNAQGRFGYKED